jgi:hypothetical protein
MDEKGFLLGQALKVKIICCRCYGQGRTWVILVTVMWYQGETNGNRSLYWDNQTRHDKTRVEAVRKSLVALLYKRTSKARRKEFLQHQTTSVYIQFVHHRRLILYMPTYYPNLLPWYFPPVTQLILIQPHHITQRCNTLDYFLIITNYTTTLSPHSSCLSTFAYFPNTNSFLTCS